MLKNRRINNLTRKSIITVLVTIFYIFLRMPSSTQANENNIWSGEFDGIPVWITVVNRGDRSSGITNPQDDWWLWGNAITDAYIFAFENPANVRLILSFDQQTNGLPEAKIYANDLGRESLDYQLRGKELQVLSNNGYPYITLRPDNGGWFVDSEVNYRLTMLIDGPLLGREGNGYPKFETDGNIDMSLKVGGETPGVADWQVLQVINDPRPDLIYPRFSANKRLPDAPQYKVANPTMPTFPYLGIVGKEINYFEASRNPIYYRLSTNELEIFGFTGLQSGIYGVNSFTYPLGVDFESPFAWYNFDSTSRYPQLVVRAGYYPSDDPPILSYRPVFNSLSSFRYSWKTTDEKNWRYSINVSGPNEYTMTETIGPEQITSIPASILPQWVLSNKWDLTTFVEATSGYPGGEGIYFYSTQTAEAIDWFYGESNNLPTYLDNPILQNSTGLIDYAALPVGFRGEYQSNSTGKTTLYMSPIDNRLHLLNAKGGVWNLGGGRILRTENLDNDAYIDGWIRQRVSNWDPNRELQEADGGEIEEALFIADNFLIYSGSAGSVLREIDVEPSIFEVQPPVNQTTWKEFVDIISPLANKERDPMDISAWLTAFPGKTLVHTSGTISAFRYTNSGFRFVLALQPGFLYSGTDWLELNGKPPGDYLVEFSNSFSISPLTPAQIKVDLQPVHVHEPEIYEQIPIQVDLTNEGLEDKDNATVIVEARNDQEITEVISQTVDLLSQTPVRLAGTWQPSKDGEWQLVSRVEDQNGLGLAKTQESILIKMGDIGSPGTIVRLSSYGFVLPILTLLLISAFFSAVVFSLAWTKHN